MKNRYINPILKNSYQNLEIGDLFDWNNIDAHRLVDAIVLSAKNPDLLRLFLDDLLTKTELEKCADRLYVAYLLSLGTPFSFINQTTGFAPATITRISKQIRNKKGGYYTTLNALYPSIPYFNY